MLQLSQTAISDQLQIGHASHPGRSGKNNEDYYGIFSVATASGECVVAAVADGIGGSVGGEQASRQTIRTLAAFLEDERYAGASPGQRLDQAIQLANREVYNKAQSDPALLGMGTTIVAVALDGDRLYAVHAGDSRAYLVRGGRAHQLTLDHSWAQEAIEAGRITAEAAKTHPNRHVIRRYLGINEDVETDARMVDPNQGAANGGRAATVLSPILTQAGDAIVLCSDGLTDEVGDDEIARLVSRHPPEEAARRLVEAANAAGGADNITVVILQRGGGKAPAAGGRSRLAAYGLAAGALLIVAALGWLFAGGTLSGQASSSAAATSLAATSAAVAAAGAEVDPPAQAAAQASPTDSPATLPAATAAAMADTPTATWTATAAATATPSPSATATPLPTATAPITLTVTSTPVSGPAGDAPPAAAMQPALGTPIAPVSTAQLQPSPTSAASVQPTSTPVMRNNSTPTPTAAPTSTRQPLPFAPGGNTAADNATGLSQSTPVSQGAPTQQPVATPIPAAGGPSFVNVISPVGNTFSTTENIRFEWKTNDALLPGQCFELVFWQPGQEWRLDGRSVKGASSDTYVDIAPNAGLSGKYQWAVLLVTCPPDYHRLDKLSPEYSIMFEGGSDSTANDDEKQGDDDPGGRP